MPSSFPRRSVSNVIVGGARPGSLLFLLLFLGLVRQHGDEGVLASGFLAINDQLVVLVLLDPLLVLFLQELIDAEEELVNPGDRVMHRHDILPRLYLGN